MLQVMNLLRCKIRWGNFDIFQGFLKQALRKDLRSKKVFEMPRTALAFFSQNVDPLISERAFVSFASFFAVKTLIKETCRKVISCCIVWCPSFVYVFDKHIRREKASIILRKSWTFFLKYCITVRITI